MMVEKVPDSTYEMVGGLDKQIKEIKEVCLLFIYLFIILFIFIHSFCVFKHIGILIRSAAFSYVVKTAIVITVYLLLEHLY